MRKAIPLFSILALVVVGCQPERLLMRLADAPTPAPVHASAAAKLPVGPVYWVLDGRALGVDSTGAIAASMQRLDPQTIQTVEVLKGQKAIERFGAEASGGVVIVTTRAARPSVE